MGEWSEREEEKEREGLERKGGRKREEIGRASCRERV